MIDNDGLFFVLAVVALLGGLYAAHALFVPDAMGLAFFARRRILREGKPAQAKIVQLDDSRRPGRNLESLRDVRMRLEVGTGASAFQCDFVTVLPWRDVDLLKLEGWVPVRFDERPRVVLDMKAFRAQVNESLDRRAEDGRKHGRSAVPWTRLGVVFLILAAVPGLLLAFRAFRDWQCERGNGEICFKLGLRRELVHRKETPDPGAAVDYYRKACARQSAAGCRALGNAYRNGYGDLPHDEASMRASYCKACRLGLAAVCKDAGNDCSAR